jgi:bifunctional non-homologous end joining protein LigD
MATPSVNLEVDGRTVTITNPEKVFYPQRGLRKIDLVEYFLAVGESALTGVRRRPCILKRYVDGVDGEPFYQKRVPAQRPEWIQTARVTFPSGRHADFIAMYDVAHIIWTVNLGCVELHPWPVRDSDVDHPDELRVDLDPTPEAPFDDVRRVAMVVRDVLADHGLAGFPKTSGSRGIHIPVRILPKWDFTTVRRAALALSREVERRVPDIATTAWWKEQRHGVFLDYNQNARDRTVAAAYSVRPMPDARVSTPLEWDEVPDVDPAQFTVDTLPQRVRERGDPAAHIDETAAGLESLLDLAARDQAGGLGDAPWPPHFAKQTGEPRRVQPSRARRDVADGAGED